MTKAVAAYDNPAFVKGAETSIPIGGSRKNWTDGERITYSWEDLNVYAPVLQGCCKKKQVSEKHILKNVTGICRPGELLAIMGASGAGKTTLLNSLTFRSDQALKIKGRLYVNGRKVSPSLLTSRSAYVQQEDLFVGTLTVKEQLTFQANLRMERGFSRADIEARVNDVMIELNLVKCAETLIGYPGRLKGISGGETKRLAFACEVLTDPPLMFCDEPTTGLDSFMALNIVEAMRNMALKGKTIISTIHQPSSEVFALFDRVLLMAEGRTAYLGSIKNGLQFFGGMGKVCPDNYNPADYYIGNLAIQPEKEEECKQFVEEACDAFEKSTAGQEVLQGAKENSRSSNGGSSFGDDQLQIHKSPYKVGWFGQFKPVLKRAVLENIREAMVLRVKVFQAIFIGLFVGVIYLNQTYDQGGVSNINGAMFIIITQISFNNTFGVVNTFCTQLPIFLREHFNGMYRTDVYFVAKNVAELPLTIFIPMLFHSIYYFMVGLNPMAERFFIGMGILVVLANTVVSFGLLISCIAKNVDVAIGLSAPLVIPLMIFGGFFLNADTIPNYFIWIKYISWFNYANEAIIINQWEGIAEIKCPNSTICSYNTGDDVIEALGYGNGTIGFDIGILFALMVGLRILAFLLLLRKTTRKSVKSYE